MKTLKTIVSVALVVCLLAMTCAVAVGCGGDDSKVKELEAKIAELEGKVSDLEADNADLSDRLEAAEELNKQYEDLTIGGTDNIDYALSSDGKSYMVLGPTEDCTTSHFEIASMYKGLPVTAIDSEAFFQYSQARFDAGETTFVLESVYIPSSIESIGEKAFANNDKLSEVVFGVGDIPEIGFETFAFCDSLTKIVLPEGLKATGANMFKATPLTDVTLPSTLEVIGDNTFWGGSLTSIDIPDSVREIGWAAFFFCTELTEINLPASLEKIGDEAFYQCTAATNNVVLPASCKYIGKFAFVHCYNLAGFTFEEPEGWFYTSDSAATEGDTISLTDPTVNIAVMSRTNDPDNVPNVRTDENGRTQFYFKKC